MHKNMAQIIVYGLTEQQFLENFELSRQVISRVVENWDQNIYIVPSKVMKREQAIMDPLKQLM